MPNIAIMVETFQDAAKATQKKTLEWAYSGDDTYVGQQKITMDLVSEGEGRHMQTVKLEASLNKMGSDRHVDVTKTKLMGEGSNHLTSTQRNISSNDSHDRHIEMTEVCEELRGYYVQNSKMDYMCNM